MQQRNRVRPAALASLNQSASYLFAVCNALCSVNLRCNFAIWRYPGTRRKLFSAFAKPVASQRLTWSESPQAVTLRVWRRRLENADSIIFVVRRDSRTPPWISSLCNVNVCSSPSVKLLAAGSLMVSSCDRTLCNRSDALLYVRSLKAACSLSLNTLRSFTGRYDSTSRILCSWQRWMETLEPNAALIAADRALAPSTTKR